MESVVETVTKEGKFVDRSKICPVLIRVFVGENQHNSLLEYSRGGTPAHELQLYTWMDTSLKELMGLIRSMGDLGRSKGSTFEYTVVFADPRSPNFKMRDIGKTVVGEPGMDDNSTLASKKFQYGDYIDVAITPRRRPAYRNTMPYNNSNNNINNNRFSNRNIPRNEKFTFNRISYRDRGDGEEEGRTNRFARDRPY